MIYRNKIGAYISLVKKILLSAILTILICNTVSAQNSPFPLKRQDYLDANKKELEKIFSSIDKDGDGKITKDEFYANPLIIPIQAKMALLRWKKKMLQSLN